MVFLDCIQIVLQIDNFVRSGDLDLPKGNRYASYISDYWTSRAYSSASYAYNLHYNAYNVDPSSNSYRWYGFSLRCLSTVLGM